MLGFGALYSFIRRQIGLRTDVANASGSLHAKVADLKDFSSEILDAIKAITTSRGSFSTASTSFVTAFSHTGAGILKQVYMSGAGVSNSIHWEIYLDGDMFSAGSVGGSEGYGYIASRGALVKDATNCDLHFSTSCEIKIKSGYTASVSTSWAIDAF